MDRLMDSEQRQLRALAAMDGLEDLLTGQGERDQIEIGHVAALVMLVFDAAREAMPQSPRYGANDE